MRNLCLVGWLFLVFEECLCSDVRMQYFFAKTDKQQCNDTVQFSDARSELESAILCAQNSACKSFRYSAGLETYYRLDMITYDTEDAHGTTEEGTTQPLAAATATTEHSTTATTTEPPGVNCTLFPNYKLNKDFNVCYKEVADSITLAEAMVDCQRDQPSAHMVTLLNTDMMDFFIDKVGGDFWIDGNYLFQTWDKKPMPWEIWKDSKRPSMSNTDAVYIHKGDRCMGKEGVGGNKNYVCEID